MTSRFNHSWVETDLSELIDIIESGLRPYGGVTEDSGEIPSLGGENIRQQGGLNLTVVKKVPREFFNLLRKGILQSEDVLINKDGANTGKVAIYQSEFSDACINEHLFLLRGKRDRLDQRFLYSLLRSHRAQATIRRKISGSAQPGLKSDFINRFPVEIPSSPSEQRRIARVLDILHEAIANTEALIAKMRQVRDGLLNDLFTRGFDENGDLRDLMVHPNRVKESSLGLIPKEWNEKSIDEIASVTKLAGFEFTNFVRYCEEGEVIALRALNIKDERLDLSDVQRIPKGVSDTLPRSKVYSGDILITYIGAYIGDVLLIQENDRFHLAPNICKVSVKAGVSPEFLQWQLRSNNTKSQIRKLITTTATPSLTMTQIRKLKVAIPKNSLEQDQIVAAIGSLDNVIRREELHQNKLYQTSNGLMQDLLSGRVRVPENLELPE